MVIMSIDNDPPAAMRYTEAKLSLLAEELLRDINKETVSFIPNDDDTTMNQWYCHQDFLTY